MFDQEGMGDNVSAIGMCFRVRSKTFLSGQCVKAYSLGASQRFPWWIPSVSDDDMLGRGNSLQIVICFVIFEFNFKGFRVILGVALGWACFVMSNGIEIMPKSDLEIDFMKFWRIDNILCFSLMFFQRTY